MWDAITGGADLTITGWMTIKIGDFVTTIDYTQSGIIAST